MIERAIKQRLERLPGVARAAQQHIGLIGLAGAVFQVKQSGVDVGFKLQLPLLQHGLCHIARQHQEVGAFVAWVHV